MKKSLIKTKILKQLKKQLELLGINPSKWELVEIDIQDGWAYSRYTHIEDINKHMTEKRNMEFQGEFFDNKTGEIIQGTYPVFN